MEVLRDVLKQDTPPPAPQTWVCPPTTVPPPPTPLAFSPSYELYEYQKQSASLLEGILRRKKRWNILCASPTGSGKSFLIKYAAKVCEKDGLKLIVGVPLVALAIQHYEDLCSLFDPTTDVLFMGGDEDDVDDFETYVPPPQRRTVPTVGVWTGPVQINELDALICVCTYEVLQIQLDTNPAFFDGAPLLILDEIHTMGEQQRGHVVENILTHHNMHCQVVGLSGTLINSTEFAEALGRSNESKTFVIGMKSRPIPLLTHVDIGNQLRHVATGKKWDEEAWRKAREDLHMDLPDNLSFVQLKTRLINLLYRLRMKEMLPTMIVAFSCRNLNKMADSVRSIDFLSGSKKAKWRVKVLFRRLQTHINDDEAWRRFFVPLERLALNGIGVHHSQLPVHYLKLVTHLATRRLCPVVFCTSTLSTGINMPVKTVVLTSSKIPTGSSGRSTLSSNLFWQMLGRAGRPGMEDKGHVVLCEWERESEWKDLFHKKPSALYGTGIVNVHTILQTMVYGSVDAKEKLTKSPFSNVFVDHLQRLYDCAISDAENRHGARQMQHVRNAIELHRCRELSRPAVARLFHVLSPGDRVLVEPIFPRLLPHIWTVSTMNKREETFGVEELDDGVPCSLDWLVDVHTPRMPRMPFAEQMALQETRECAELVLEGPSTTPIDCIEDVEALDLFQRRFLPTNTFGKTFEHLKARLVKYEYVRDQHVVTRKGRVAVHLLVDDPIALTESLFRNVLPRHDVHLFVACLTCFLAPTTSMDTSTHNLSSLTATYVEGLYHLVDEVGQTAIGTEFVDAMYAWSTGRSLVFIVSQYRVKVGKFCSMVSRTIQLLRQMSAVLWTETDKELCTNATRNISRGLPVLSIL